eukprot:30734-Eustigmatos_ZCMA.PRE.1
MSSTFFALSRRHIAFFYERLDEIRARCEAVENNGVNTEHPEEWWLVPFVTQHRLVYIDFPMMDRCMSTWDAPHPIFWTSLDKTKRLQWDAQGTKTYSLESYLKVNTLPPLTWSTYGTTGQ